MKFSEKIESKLESFAARVAKRRGIELQEARDYVGEVGIKRLTTLYKFADANRGEAKPKKAKTAKPAKAPKTAKKTPAKAPSKPKAARKAKPSTAAAPAAQTPPPAAPPAAPATGSDLV